MMMQTLPRSKSAPHIPGANPTVSAAHPHRGTSSHARHSNLERHYSTIALASLSSSEHVKGQQSPRREEDPFSLAGFFPASLTHTYATHSAVHAEWEWLRGGAEEVLRQTWGRTNGYESPVSSEDEEWIPATPGTMFDNEEEEEEETCKETIRQEDKLGVLALESRLLSLEAGSDMVPHYPLISPYAKDEVVDTEALYNGLCALRRTHTTRETEAGMGSGPGPGKYGMLFGCGGGEGEGEGEEALGGGGGLGKMISMLLGVAESVSVSV